MGALILLFFNFYWSIVVLQCCVSVFCTAKWISYVVVQLPSHVQLFATPWTAAHQAFLSLTISWSLPKFMFIASVMSSSHFSSDTLFSFCPQSFSASGTFPLSQLFASDDQNTGASASSSVLPMSIQGWCPLKLTGLISLLSKEISEVFLSTTVLSRQFFGALSFLWSSSHPHMTTGKTITLTVWTFVSRVMSVLFNTLSRFIIASLPRSNFLLISWLQSPTTVILECKKRKSHYFHLSPFYLP